MTLDRLNTLEFINLSNWLDDQRSETPCVMVTHSSRYERTDACCSLGLLLPIHVHMCVLARSKLLIRCMLDCHAYTTAAAAGTRVCSRYIVLGQLGP